MSRVDRERDSTPAKKPRKAAKGASGRAKKTAGDKPANAGTRTKVSDRWLDEWRTITGEPLRDIAAALVTAIDADQRKHGVRKNERGEAKQKAFVQRIETITADLAYAVLRPPLKKRIAVSRRKRSPTRYDNRNMGVENITPILDSLERLEIITVKKGEWAGRNQKGQATTITPTKGFRTEVEAYGVTLADFGRAHGQEVLLLKRVEPKSAAVDIDEPDEGGPSIMDMLEAASKVGSWVNYADTPETIRLRGQVQALGRFMQEADLRLATGDVIDASDRVLKRHFNQSATEAGERFDLGGRLFHRRLSHMGKPERRSLIIEGSPIISLDYSTMFARLGYAHVNTPAPTGDLYDWQGFGPAYRNGVKKGFNALLNGGGRGERFGAGVQKLLPKGMSAQQFRQAFAKHHPALVPLLDADAGGGLAIGFALMNTESVVMVTVLERLMAQGVVAIGLHDGLLIGEDRAKVAMEVMTETVREVAGVDIPVKVEDAGE